MEDGNGIEVMEEVVKETQEAIVESTETVLESVAVDVLAVYEEGKPDDTRLEIPPEAAPSLASV